MFESTYVNQYYFIFLGYLLVINAISLFLFYIDKKYAVHGDFRIPESTLLSSIFFGGILGALLGMKKFRHKNKKSSFILKFVLVILLQISIAILTALYFNGVLSNVKF